MSYEELLRKRAIEPAEVSEKEILEHLRLARHDISISRDIASIDLDWAFNIAYNGILQTSLAFMYSEGYRPRGEGKHVNTFRFLQNALPDSSMKEVDYLQKLRRKRNRAVYDRRGIISEKEMKGIIDFAEDFFDDIMDFMPDRYKNLLRYKDK